MNYPGERTSVSLSARISATFVPPELTALKQWHVQRHLGSGSTAHVWLLEHESGKYLAACKTPKTPDDIEMLSQEAKLAQSLRHENLVRVLEAESLGLSATEISVGTFWEFLPAGSLSDLVSAGGRLSVAETVTVLLPMIQVAQYLHTNQIVHGDISPANILFDLEGRPALIDLGTVRATAHAFHSAGTPGFIAPEIDDPRRGFEGLGVAADVYSLAAIGWFCLTGTIPGLPHSRMPLVMLAPDIEPDIVTILEACLSAEPVLRPSMTQLLTSVTRWDEPVPVDLFASAGEEYELLLPTKRTRESAPRRLGKSRLNRKNETSGRVKRKGHDSRDVHRRRKRLVVGLSACVLLAGAAVTVVYGEQTSSRVADVPSEDFVMEESVDFQAVVDAVAKARTAAWASSDASQVQHYAVEGSAVFADDMEVLTTLEETSTTLDGIRMRAVVEAVEHTSESVAVEVAWRTDEYLQRDGSQDIVETNEARTERLVLYLIETPHGWRLNSVEARMNTAMKK